MTRNPRRTRPLLRNTLYLLPAVVIGAGVFLWLLPALLTRHPSHGVTAVEHLKAVNDARGPLVAFLITIGAAGTLWFTGETYRLNREGHVTDRYTKAVGQLGDGSAPVRIGGVYALERIGNDSPKDTTTIVYVLGAFIRERSHDTRERPDVPAEDVRAGLRVVGRLLPKTSVQLDLRGADLRNTNLADMPANRVILDGANVKDAVLPRL